MDKISFIKKRNLKRHDACHHLILDDKCPDYLPTQDYYDTFWKTFLMNQIKQTKLKLLEGEVEGLQAEVKWLDRKFNQYGELVSYRKEKHKKYRCQVSRCKREYDSRQALLLHQELKHKMGEVMEKIAE